MDAVRLQQVRHLIQPGDSLEEISDLYQVTRTALVHANGFSDYHPKVMNPSPSAAEQKSNPFHQRADTNMLINEHPCTC